jgi:hypothetical protein
VNDENQTGEKAEIKICIDLCSGLGGFSRAFREREDWEVILASPPCERFSIANRSWPQKGIGKALEIVGACLEAIVDLKPDYWALENPKGRLRWFLGSPPHSVRLSDYGYDKAVSGGKWRKAIKPTDIWGNIPFPMLEAEKEPKIGRVETGFTKVSRAKRAEMPYGLSQTILEAVDT